MEKGKKQIISFIMLTFAFSLYWLFNVSYVDAKSNESPPTLGSIRVIQDEIYAPDTLQFELKDIVEEGMGIYNIVIELSYYDQEVKTWKSLTIYKMYESLDPNNPIMPIFSTKKLIISEHIPAATTSGLYYIQNVSLYTYGKYHQVYGLRNDLEIVLNGSPSYSLHSSIDNSNCTVTNGSVKITGETYDISTSVSNPNVAALINKMDDGETINLIAAYNNTTVHKAAFDAIKGTNKIINVSVSDGIKWIFDGKDINQTTKAVDCKIDISTIQEESFGTTEKLMRTTFANNGTLPGKGIRLTSTTSTVII